MKIFVNIRSIFHFFQVHDGLWQIQGEYTGFPLGLENLEKWEGIFQSGKSQGIFNRLGKVRENHTKYWKNIREFQKNVKLFFSDI